MKFYKKMWSLRVVIKGKNKLRIENENKNKKQIWLQPGSKRGRPHESPA